MFDRDHGFRITRAGCGALILMWHAQPVRKRAPGANDLTMKTLLAGSFFLISLIASNAWADHVTLYDDDITAFQSGKRIDVAKSGKLKMFVCEEHFPPGSAARDEVYRSAKAFNDAPGVKVHIEIKYGPHKNKAALYASPPQYDFSFEYVDNVDTVADPGHNPCHSNGGTACWDWTMNTCHYDGTWPAAGSTSSHVVFAV